MSIATVEIINKILAVGTIVVQAIVLLMVVLLTFNKKSIILSFFKDNTIVFGFLATISAVVLSLFYSEIVGYAACTLCWYQRIFIYPQLVLFAMALHRKDKSIVDYSLVLSSIGILFSIYQVYIENGGSLNSFCSGSVVSCATRYVFEFGYITIPVMCLTLFAFLIVLAWNYKKK